jgi:hypothetical protein
MPVRLLPPVVLLSLLLPAIAAGQDAGGVTVQAAAGLHDVRIGGNTQSIAVGFAPDERWEFLFAAERTHRPTQITSFAAERGGTTTFFSGEVRFAPVTFNRVSPYVLASAGRGISRLNVNETFPNRVTNDAWLMLFGGGGIRVEVTERLSLFSDLRFGLQGESDVIVLLLPLRGGVAWRF